MNGPFGNRHISLFIWSIFLKSIFHYSIGMKILLALLIIWSYETIGVTPVPEHNLTNPTTIPIDNEIMLETKSPTASPTEYRSFNPTTITDINESIHDMTLPIEGRRFNTANHYIINGVWENNPTNPTTNTIDNEIISTQSGF